MQRIWIRLLCSSVLVFAGCQIAPPAQGLKSAQWQAQQYQRQDQVEVQWKDKSFSFLLYQQQQGQQLELLALGLTGQPLFQLQFDGQQVKVQQRIEQMRLLPFDFLVRDILYATYPHFAQLGQTAVSVQQQADQQQILIGQKPVLNIQQQGNRIDINNLQVPYQMLFSPIENTLNNTSSAQGTPP